MWLLFHRNAKTRPVPGGQRFVETCPECHRRATFVEVEMTENFGMFFVDVVGDTQRAYRCSDCGETFDLKDDDAAAPAPLEVTAKSTAETERERKAASEAKAVRIDDELAELKKRMGRA
jgi:transposase-like protein